MGFCSELGIVFIDAPVRAICVSLLPDTAHGSDSSAALNLAAFSTISLSAQFVDNSPRSNSYLLPLLPLPLLAPSIASPFPAPTPTFPPTLFPFRTPSILSRALYHAPATNQPPLPPQPEKSTTVAHPPEPPSLALGEGRGRTACPQRDAHTHDALRPPPSCTVLSNLSSRTWTYAVE